MPEHAVSHSSDSKNGRGGLRAFVFWLPVALLAVADQLVKYLASSHRLELIFRLTRTLISQMNFKNFNFAFSLRLPEWLIYFIYGLALYFIFHYLTDHFAALPKAQTIAWI